MLSNLKAGDKVITHFSLYGGSEELLQKVLSQFDIEAIITDLRNLDAAEDIIKNDSTIKMMYLETPANPTLRCVDIEVLTSISKKYNLKVACDNTFATPYLQQPFKYGVDFVIHSTTKFLNGHGNMIGGILLGRDIDFMTAKVAKTHHLTGGNSNPFDAFLLINGLKTLELRMDRHCSNAMAVAEYLSQHAKVAQVNYTGLTSHPDYQIAKKQMRLDGGVLSFELKEGFDAGVRFMNRLRMCVRTVSLGTCDTLLCHSASMTHYGIPREQREQYGITDGLIRMNVGIENVADIIADFEEALR
jgi:methionine-gamma-lyase